MKIDQDMYDFVMRNCDKNLINKDDIIDYLICQCYYIDLYNEELKDKIDRITEIINPQKYIFKDDDLPF